MLALTKGEQCQICALPGMMETLQRKSRTRRKRKELLLGQMCFMGCLMLLASAVSHWAGILGIEENNSLHRNQRNVLDVNANSNGRGLLWADDENFTEIQGEHRHRKNCTEPERPLFA
ncbi:hypothetical protein GDO81_021428 [Engystomops pustulosus]|uniref:Uncharacterized protein n=1 Tax=Engystomops pustulosus TaxID=76066 RepID=A0AAV6ZJ27_ENGPU|nr:hypothetical protein GDO81_021428 [Engystomops pustulosus]